MRAFTPLEEKNQKYLVNKGVEFTQVQITSVGINKGILDATIPMRTYFLEHGIHNYDSQKFSPAYKVMIPTYDLHFEKIVETNTSMYRANHRGDPRMWFGKKVKQYAKPDDIYIIIAYEHELYIINHTQIDIEECCETSIVNPIKEFIEEITCVQSDIALELLTKLRAYHGQWIPSDINADTAIGRKVETLLGIPMNSSKKPDYKGIELKSFRDKRPSVRKNMFTKVPEWEFSRLKGVREIASIYGYPAHVPFKMYHNTLQYQKPNSQHLNLNITKGNTLLAIEEGALILSSNNELKYKTINDVAVWRLTELHKELLKKHNETFWIEVHSQMQSGREYFKFIEVEHTRHPVFSQFDTLIERGAITVDLLLGRGIDRYTGKRIKKAGDTVSFKIKKNSTGLLFPNPVKYTL